MSGKQVKLFLVDGSAGGLTTAEITNWTGKVISAPRSDLAELLKRTEAERTGAYVLLGDDPDALGGQRCYIGEADVIASRLRQHAGSDRGKDFWARVLIITSKDDNLTKAHGRYLEARLIRMAAQAGRAQVENGTSPGDPPLPEADISDMDYFLTQLLIIMPVLGVNVFRGRVSRSAAPGPTSQPPASSPVFWLKVPRHGISASAQQIDGEFTVMAGSSVAPFVRTKESFAVSTSSAYAAYERLHEKLREDGSIEVGGTVATLVRDVVFSSPSTAGAIVTGRSCNGRKQWVTEEGMQFGAWEERGV